MRIRSLMAVAVVVPVVAALVSPAVAAPLREYTLAGDPRVEAMTVDELGNVVVREGHRLRVVEPSGVSRALARLPGTGADLAALGDGRIAVAEPDAHRVLSVDRAGRVTALAGTGVAGVPGVSRPAPGTQLMNSRHRTPP